jgi:flagellar hook-associated protein 1 FlgK
MSSLFGSLSIALRSLLAQQGAMATTSNNIANVNTPGYARQRAVLREESPVFVGSLLFGTGVTLSSIESIRDRILELRLDQETQGRGRLEAYLGGARQIENLFNEAAGAGLENVLSKFFASLQAASANPTNLPLRQAVLAAGEDLAAAFRRASQSLSTLQASLNRDVTQTVGEINALTAEIADLNRQISALKGAGQDPAALLDRRALLIRELSARIDIAEIDANGHSLTLTTTRGTALVVAEHAVELQLQTDPSTGNSLVYAHNSNITNAITGGRLGGVLSARDQAIPAALGDLDNLAASLGTALNAQHRAGFDLAGVAGGDLFAPFTPTAGSNAGAAAAFTFVLADPAKLAASADEAPGNTDNLRALAALRDQGIVQGQKPLDFYARLVFRVGNEVKNAQDELDVQEITLRQLENQRSALSGVSLDEEAMNLMRYQRAFEASARVVSAINELTEVAINFGRY